MYILYLTTFFYYTRIKYILCILTLLMNRLIYYKFKLQNRIKFTSNLLVTWRRARELRYILYVFINKYSYKRNWLNIVKLQANYNPFPGVISKERLDLSVARVLELKYILNLFENPMPNPDLVPKVFCSEHQ